MDWIACAERLPELRLTPDGSMEESDEVLVCAYRWAEGEQRVRSVLRLSRYDDTDLHWVSYDSEQWFQPDDVTHWAPLPALPKLGGS